MEIKVKLFAVLKETAGWDESVLHLPHEISCSEVLTCLKNKFPSIALILESCFVAINGNYVDQDTIVFMGDEVAILPPVSGG